MQTECLRIGQVRTKERARLASMALPPGPVVTKVQKTAKPQPKRATQGGAGAGGLLAAAAQRSAGHSAARAAQQPTMASVRLLNAGTRVCYTHVCLLAAAAQQSTVSHRGTRNPAADRALNDFDLIFLTSCC